MRYFAYDENDRQIPFLVEEKGGIIKLTLPLSEFKSAKSLRLLPEISEARAGDDGFYILPRSIGMRGDVQILFTERENDALSYSKPVMAVYGIKRSNECLLVRFDRNYKFSINATLESGVYRTFLSTAFGGKNDLPYDDVRIEIISLKADAELGDLAKAERELRLSRGEITTLDEKCRERAVVDYARRAPIIRIRMAWKQSPSPVKHQTPETQPPVFVACDFARVRDIADALNERGVKECELQLVGWNLGGHDGAFPQLFPVEPTLGGEEEMKKTFAHVKSLGYRISTHTNLIDSYEIANCFSWDDVVITEEGEYLQVGDYGGGLAYHVCPERQMYNSLRTIPELARYGENGLHFNDVISIVEPDTCHSPLHPCTTADGIRYVNSIMNYQRGIFGGFSSEGCFDFALGNLDYGLYVSFGDGFGHKEFPLVSRHVPFFELTYHGILLYNPTSPTVNYPIKTPADRLTFVLRGGKPTFYFHSRFRTGAKNWMGETDLITDTDEDLFRAADIIAESTREYAGLIRLQTLFMTNYEYSADSALEIASYEDGTRIVGNFSENVQKYCGREILPGEYAILSR